MAEGIFRQKLEGVHEILSAGFSSPIGSPPDTFAIRACAENGIDISSHRAARLDPELLKSQDLILTMETTQVRRIITAFPWLSGRVWRLGHPLGIDYPDLLGQSFEHFRDFHRSVLEALSAWEPQIRT